MISWFTKYFFKWNLYHYKTGFGDRLGLLFVKAFGKTTLSLAYGLQAAETVLSPAMPSTTARAAGVFVPIVNSLDKRTKAYLIGQQLQGGNATSTLLISAAAQNFLCIQLAAGLEATFHSRHFAQSKHGSIDASQNTVQSTPASTVHVKTVRWVGTFRHGNLQFKHGSIDDREYGLHVTNQSDTPRGVSANPTWRRRRASSEGSPRP